jgi:hypothetical protein
MAASLSATLVGFSRKTSLSHRPLPVRDPAMIKELRWNNVHDVVVVLVDAAFAFELPGLSSGWVETFDVETGATRMLSRREARNLQSRVQGWQDEVARMARQADLDVLRLGTNQTKFDIALLEWVQERRLRRK